MNIPDRVVFGLTARQLLILLIGCSAGYNLWLQLHLLASYAVLGVVARAGFALLPAAASLALALLSVAGRPLEVWALVLLRYWQRPRTFVWRSVRISQQRKRAAFHRPAQPEYPPWSPGKLAGRRAAFESHATHRSCCCLGFLPDGLIARGRMPEPPL